jgi:hypothetical protein
LLIKVKKINKKLEITPYVFEWDEKREAPVHLYKRMAELGCGAHQASEKWPQEYAGS